MGEYDPEKINFIGINPKEGEEALNFARKYVEVFNDTICSLTIKKIERTQTMTLGQFKSLKGKQSSISLEEIKDPKRYIQKYTKIFHVIERAIASSSINSFNREKLESLTEFFKDRLYLTTKQIALFMACARDLEEDYATSERARELNKKEILEKLVLPSLTEAGKKLAGFWPTPFEKSAEEAGKTLGALLKKETEKASREEKIDSSEEPPKEIKQIFFSLTEIRNSLMVE